MINICHYLSNLPCFLKSGLNARWCSMQSLEAIDIIKKCIKELETCLGRRAIVPQPKSFHQRGGYIQRWGFHTMRVSPNHLKLDNFGIEIDIETHSFRDPPFQKTPRWRFDGILCSEDRIWLIGILHLAILTGSFEHPEALHCRFARVQMSCPWRDQTGFAILLVLLVWSCSCLACWQARSWARLALRKCSASLGGAKSLPFPPWICSRCNTHQETDEKEQEAFPCISFKSCRGCERATSDLSNTRFWAPMSYLAMETYGLNG